MPEWNWADKGVSPVVSMLAEDSDANFAAVRDENFVLANTGVSRTEISASAGTDEAPYIVLAFDGNLTEEQIKENLKIFNDRNAELNIDWMTDDSQFNPDEDVSATTIADMEKTVLDAGWDGDWFLRAYDAMSNPVGSKVCEEGQIFIEPQGMCVMAGIGTDITEDGSPSAAARALRSVEERLDTRYGIILQTPAYTTYHVELGEISSYPPGYKENAGIFCHNNPWISCAEAVLGHGSRAFEVFKKTCPAYLEDQSEIRRTEPYVYCQMMAGRDAPTHGEGKNSWLTGTAAWTFTCISQYILGIQPTLLGLRINPCIPSDWSGYTCRRTYRGVSYDITIDNSAHVESGVASVTVDGQPVTGTLIPFDAGKKTCKVEVVLG